MIHEEITTKLDLSGDHKLSESKVVHVNFGERVAKKSVAAEAPTSPTTIVSAPIRRQSTLFPGWEAIDFRLPWTLRLIAALAIVALSILIF